MLLKKKLKKSQLVLFSWLENHKSEEKPWLKAIQST